MTNEELKKLENDLWSAANNLRANSDLKSSEYATPVLGIIFLKFADNKYSRFEEEINKIHSSQKSRNRRDIQDIAVEKCGFYLPADARNQYLLDTPEEGRLIRNTEGKKETAKIEKPIKIAMNLIEETQDEKFKDTLPKDEYFRIAKSNPTITPSLLKKMLDDKLYPDQVFKEKRDQLFQHAEQGIYYS